MLGFPIEATSTSSSLGIVITEVNIHFLLMTFVSINSSSPLVKAVYLGPYSIFDN
jgi:hypothetical protein